MPATQHGTHLTAHMQWTAWARTAEPPRADPHTRLRGAALARDELGAHQRKVDGGKAGPVVAQRAALVARVPAQVLAALLPGNEGRAARS